MWRESEGSATSGWTEMVEAGLMVSGKEGTGWVVVVSVKEEPTTGRKEGMGSDDGMEVISGSTVIC